MLNDFYQINSSRVDSIISKLNEYNGIRFYIEDAESVNFLMKVIKRVDVPVAVDCTACADSSILQELSRIKAEYWIISSPRQIEYVPSGTIIIYSVLIDEDAKLDSHEILSLSKTVDYYEIEFWLDKITKKQDIVSFVSDLNSNEIKFSISGLPLCVAEFRDNADLSFVDNKKLTKTKSERCNRCNSFNKACPGCDDKELLLFHHEEKLKTVDFGNIQAEATILYSGGLDSRVATARYLEKNPSSKVLLIHFSDWNQPGLARVKMGYYKDMNRYDNVLGLLLINLPFDTYHDVIRNETVLRLSDKYDTNLTCIMCKAIFMYYALAICKKIGASTIVMGNNQVRGYGKKEPPFPQSLAAVSEYNKLASKFDVRLEQPLFCLSERAHVVEIAKNYGMELSSSLCASSCQYGNPKPLRRGEEFAIGFLQKYIDELSTNTTEFRSMLERGKCYGELLL